MKKLLLLLLIFTTLLSAMQGGSKRPASAVPEMAAISSASQKQKIEKEQSETIVVQPPAIAWRSGLVELPTDVKEIILKLLIEARGDTNETRLRAAAQNIRNFMTLSKAFKPLLDDARVADWIIQELANRYISGDLIRAAPALQTNAAGKWLAAYVGNDPSKINKLGVVLTDEARLGDLGAVKLILKYFPQLVNARGVDNATALILAADEGHTAIVNRLLQVPGIDVNLQDSNEYTALLYAAKKGHTAIVERLLQVPGIDVNAPYADTPLIYAAYYGHAAIVELLLQVPQIDVNIRDVDGNTALIDATREGHRAIVERLLQVQGINVNAQNEEGETALGLARASNNQNKEAIIKLLLDHGAVE